MIQFCSAQNCCRRQNHLLEIHDFSSFTFFSNSFQHTYRFSVQQKLSPYACCTDIGTRAVASRGSTLLGPLCRRHYLSLQRSAKPTLSFHHAPGCPVHEYLLPGFHHPRLAFTDRLFTTFPFNACQYSKTNKLINIIPHSIPYVKYHTCPFDPKICDFKRPKRISIKARMTF